MTNSMKRKKLFTPENASKFIPVLISSGLAMVLRSSRTIGALEKDVPSVEGGDSNA